MIAIERIGTEDALDRLRPQWEELYARDEHRSVFLSWPWLRSYLPTGRYAWSILLARDGTELIALLPVARSGFPHRSLSLDRELHMGANPAADYTGMLCLPGREHEAIAAFAGVIARDAWENFNLSDTRDPRMEQLARQIAARVRGTFEQLGDERCMYIELPATWDEYLRGLPKDSRRKTLRVMRLVAELPGYRVTEATAADFEQHVEILFRLKIARFGGALRRFRARNGTFFRNAFAAGALRIFVMWDGERPVSATAIFVDEARESFNIYMRGHDAEYDRRGPGRAMTGLMIQRAIEDGYRRFDFLRGDYPYKHDFTDTSVSLRHYRVTRPGLRARAVNALRPAFAALKLRIANIAFRRA